MKTILAVILLGIINGQAHAQVNLYTMTIEDFPATSADRYFFGLKATPLGFEPTVIVLTTAIVATSITLRVPTS